MSTILVTNKKMRYHVDLSIELKHPVDDPIATYFELGYEALQNIIANASPSLWFQDTQTVL